jgi:uncharacterized membrane protein YecN with MAPEG domain
MISLPIATAFAAIFSIALIPLTIQVGLKRLQTKIFFGDGGDAGLIQRRTAQINFLEHVPLFMVTLTLCELIGAPYQVLMTAGCSMFAGRTFHAFCMLFTKGTGNSRAVGMVLTFAAHLITGVYLAAVGLGFTGQTSGI